jgi:hypothetical protein
LNYGEKGVEVLFEVLEKEKEKNLDIYWFVYQLLNKESEEFKYVTKKTKVDKEIELSLWDKLLGKPNIEEVELEIVEKDYNYNQLNQKMKQNIKERLIHYFPCYEFESVTVNPTFRTWHKELELIQDGLDWQKCFPTKVSAITIC